jgi:hypothetical protein
MIKKWKPSPPWLRRKVKQGFRGYPIATIAFYGPSADLATKIVVAIVRDEGREPDPLERWFSEDTDVRTNPAVGVKVLAFLKEHATKSVIVTDGLIGCPHEEASITPRENPARSAPTGLAVIASLASVSSEPRTLRRFDFSFSCSLLFSTSSPIGTSSAPERRRFCKSLISRWFLYSNQSCCAAPF